MIDTSLSSWNFYLLFAVFQGFLVSGFIFLKRPPNKPNTYFGIIILFFTLALLHLVLEQSIQAFNSKFPIPMEFTMSYGPLAYLHIKHIKDPSRKFSTKDLLHFLPSLVFDVLFFTFAFLWIRANLDWAYSNIPLIQGIALIVAFIGMIILAIYTYMIYKELADTRPLLKEFNEVKKWLYTLIISWSSIILFFALTVPISLLFIEAFDDNSHLIYRPLQTMTALFIFILGYLYLTRYSNVLRNYRDRIAKFKISEDELDSKKKEIINALERDKLYEDPSITLARLAGHLGWPINSVSTLINDTLHTNFNDLINQYRVAAFKQIAIKPESSKYSILGLGKEVGFSSKASFYRIFKKETGMTPSEFIQSEA